jgi:sterol desaturase/sphingolipid hydroxylase (fatty acid hydroxylase superfamily)
VLLVAERRAPLRTRRNPGAGRVLGNVARAGLAAVVVGVFERPLVAPLSQRVVQRRSGLTQQGRVPAAGRDLLAVVLMDYTLYLWHVLMHRSAALYRLHRIHHADLDLDASTALRFAAREMLASVPWRLGQVRLLGVSPRALRLWQRLTAASVLFHHSNLRLPWRIERVLCLVVMTPRLHGIHHSDRPAEQESNWSSGLTLWDRLHGTLRTDVPQASIRVGPLPLPRTTERPAGSPAATGTVARPSRGARSR